MEDLLDNNKSNSLDNSQDENSKKDTKDSPGHVFVLHGDLGKLSCDAWMLPTDEKLSVEETWGVSLTEPLIKPENWCNEGRRVIKLTELHNWPPSRSPPWLVNVGGIKMPICELCNDRGATLFCEKDNANLCSTCDDKVHGANPIAHNHIRTQVKKIEWYIEGARKFFEKVAADLEGKEPLNGRARKLVALPLVGTGKGGAEKSTGGMVVALFSELYRAAAHYGFDIALVTITYPVFAAIQVQRSRLAKEGKFWDNVLSENIREEAQRLAKLAKDGDLVLFMGSGVSASAGGLPTWNSLLSDLGKMAGLSEKELQMIQEMNYLDAARIIEIKLGGSTNLNKAVAERVQVHSYSLACGLLAGLGVREVVTTNYNEMYELCCRSVGQNIAVLPYSPASDCDRWILKLHGCVTHPEDIVLTREHYMRYGTRRSALSGIVQSLLITRHMLFVGFSLKDDNFHRIIDEVRRSVRKTTYEPSSPRDSGINIKSKNFSVSHTPPNMRGLLGCVAKSGLASSRLKQENTLNDSYPPHSLDQKKTTFQDRKFGTQLVLVENPITRMLWDEDVYIVAMTGEDANKSERQNAARKFDIFLDYLLSLATSTTSFLLNPRYDALLEEGQRELRNSVYKLIHELSPLGKTAPEYKLLRKLLMELGLDEESTVPQAPISKSQ